MSTLPELHLDHHAQSRMSQLMTRYRVLVHVLLLAAACSLAYADRQHARQTAPRISASQVSDTD